MTSVRRNPIVFNSQLVCWLIAATILTVSMFVWIGWHVQNSFRVIQKLESQSIKIETVFNEITLLSVQISELARVAIAHHDSIQSPIKEHQILTIKLEEKMEEIIRLAGEQDTAALTKAQSAHHTLRAMEVRAFDWIRFHQATKALNYLFGKNYDRHRQIFMDAMSEYISTIRRSLLVNLKKESTRELYSLTVAFVIFITSFSCWIMLIQKLRYLDMALLKEVIERRANGKKLERSERKYQNLFEYANDPIFIIDPTTRRFLEVNQKAVNFLGYNREELLGLRWEDLIVEKINLKEQILLLNRNESVVLECLYRRKDDSRFPVEISGRSINDGEKEVYQCFVRDITERKRFQEERLHAQKIQAIGQLAGGIAHDFRNLLMVIHGFIALAQKSLPADHPASTNLRLIEQAIEQANDMIKALLTFGRKQVMERQAMKLGELVATTVQIFRRVLPAAIILETDMDKAPVIWVDGDKAQLQQVLMNLMINARGAMPDGGLLRISLSLSSENHHDGSDGIESTAPQVYLRISDTGIGMTPETQARIFEPFFTTKPRGQGTGLGLATAYGIVVQHGGRLEVQSAVGQGSSFTVVLPVIPPPDSPRTDSVSGLNPARGNGETILLAEDHRYVREIMATSLQSRGYRVIQVDNGSDLLDSYQTHRARLRLLIVDLDLPRGNGLDCVRQLRADGKRLPVIFTTGLKPSVDLTDALDGEAVLLRKPFQMNTLLDLIANLLAVPSLERECG